MTTWICEGEELCLKPYCTCEITGSNEPNKCVFDGDDVIWIKTDKYEIRERQPEQPKRYRVKIPDMIRKEDAELVNQILHHDGEEYSEGLLKNIPKDWLHPLEMTAEEIAKNSLSTPHVSKTAYGVTCAKRGISEGIRCEREKHKQTQTFEDVKNDFLKRNDINKHFGEKTPTSPDLIFRTIAQHFWEESRKSLGYEPE